MTIDAARVVVRGAAGSVTVSRAPFALTYRDRRGRAVLASAPAAGRLQVEPAVPRQLFGRQDPPRPALYAPLSFLVGDAAIEQTPASQWEGTLKSVPRRRRRVPRPTASLSARRSGGGCALALVHDRPERPAAACYVGPAAHGLLRVSARPSPSHGVATMPVLRTARAARRSTASAAAMTSSTSAAATSQLSTSRRTSARPRRALTAPRPTERRPLHFPNGPSAAYASSRASSPRPATASCSTATSSRTGVWAPTAPAPGGSAPPPRRSTTWSSPARRRGRSGRSARSTVATASRPAGRSGRRSTGGAVPLRSRRALRARGTPGPARHDRYRLRSTPTASRAGSSCPSGAEEDHPRASPARHQADRLLPRLRRQRRDRHRLPRRLRRGAAQGLRRDAPGRLAVRLREQLRARGRA